MVFVVFSVPVQFSVALRPQKPQVYQGRGPRTSIDFHTAPELLMFHQSSDNWIDDRLYSAIFRSLEQAHCARMWCYMSD